MESTRGLTHHALLCDVTKLMDMEAMESTSELTQHALPCDVPVLMDMEAMESITVLEQFWRILLYLTDDSIAKLYVTSNYVK